MAKLTPKQRATAQIGFLLGMHAEDIDDATDLIHNLKTQADVAELERTLSILKDYSEYLEMEVAACRDNDES